MSRITISRVELFSELEMVQRASKYFPRLKPGHGSRSGKSVCNAPGCSIMKKPDNHFQDPEEAAKTALRANGLIR